jgi:hypothetical protein
LCPSVWSIRGEIGWGIVIVKGWNSIDGIDGKLVGKAMACRRVIFTELYELMIRERFMYGGLGFGLINGEIEVLEPYIVPYV